MSKLAPSRMPRHKLVLELVRYGCDRDDLLAMQRPRLARMVTEHRRRRASTKAKMTAAAKDGGAVGELAADASPESTAGHETGGGSSVPAITAVGWAQYVLGQFADDELDGHNPRVEGLRRVAELLLGEIVEEDCELVQAPSAENGMRASARARISFLKDGRTRTFTGLADAGPDNCTDEFGRFPVAMAETRAKGRAFRAALRLRRVVAAEEVAGMPLDGERLDEQAIQVGQVNIISLLAERQRVSVPALLKHVGVEKDDFKKLTRAEGLLVARTLNEMRESGLVPDGLKSSG